MRVLAEAVKGKKNPVTLVATVVVRNTVVQVFRFIATPRIPGRKAVFVVRM